MGEIGGSKGIWSVQLPSLQDDSFGDFTLNELVMTDSFFDPVCPIPGHSWVCPSFLNFSNLLADISEGCAICWLGWVQSKCHFMTIGPSNHGLMQFSVSALCPQVFSHTVLYG